jgi:hypothetical protein
MFEATKTKYMNAATSIAGILGPMTGKKPIEDELGDINLKPLGYIFGFLEIALQVRNLSIDNTYGVLTFEVILDTLWPNKGKYYLATFVSHSNDSELIDVCGYGRSGYANLLNNDAIPFGLALTILAKETLDAKNRLIEEISKLKNNKQSFSITDGRKKYALHEALVTQKIDALANNLIT